MLAEFNINNCCGRCVDKVVIPVDDDCIDKYESDIGYEYTYDVLAAAGLRQRVCEGCYNDAYRVRFVVFVAELVAQPE